MIMNLLCPPNMSQYKIVAKVWVLRSSDEVYRNLFATELDGLQRSYICIYIALCNL